MARYGHLICRQCREEIFIGKWLTTDDDKGIGFWHGQLCKEGEADSPRLGRKVLRFLAAHMGHDLIIASDEGGRFETIEDELDLRNVDELWDSEAKLGEP